MLRLVRPCTVTFRSSRRLNDRTAAAASSFILVELREVVRIAGMYTRAAICRRGHWISFDISRSSSDFCQTCGAAVITACDSCGTGLLGVEINSEIVVFRTEAPQPPRFCEKCGAPFPWLDRAGRIYELQNRLDREQLDPATELTVREQLDALVDPELSDQEQQQRWERVRRLAPGLWSRSQNIVESLASAAIKHELGL